jgi:hypothetical protein
MPRHLGRQGEWPRVKRNPDAYFQTADGWLKSERSLAGPLRLGTTPGVGPRGGAILGDGSSDFGMDRIAPRDFDPMGTPRSRSGEIPSDLISREIRGRRR